jgi:hypothetical protein
MQPASEDCERIYTRELTGGVARRPRYLVFANLRAEIAWIRCGDISDLLEAGFTRIMAGSRKGLARVAVREASGWNNPHR